MSKFKGILMELSRNLKIRLKKKTFSVKNIQFNIISYKVFEN